jgi:DNA-binding Lrp family transcriptional regulator
MELRDIEGEDWPDEETRRFFEVEHAISPEVWRTRPYIRWWTDNMGPIREAYLGLKGIRDTLKKAEQQPGWIISRHAPPGLGLDHVYPEIRPDHPVRRTGISKHYHGDPALVPPPKEQCPNHSKTYCTNCVSPWRTYRPDSKPMRDDHIPKAIDNRVEVVRDGRQIEIHYGGHGGVNINVVHFHRDEAKYNFPAGPGAKRFDMHRLAIPLFRDARLVFLCLEGCIKSDSVLSEIRKTHLRAAVLSVPSVTLWDREPEFYLIVDRYLRGRTVVIVPDADWRDPDPKKSAVRTQARLCQGRLRRLGIDAHVAAPPFDAWRANHKLKGIDDHLAAHHMLGELEVIDKELSTKIRRFVREHTSRIDQMRRDIEILEALSIHADDNGQLCPTVQAIAKIMNTPPSRVSDGLKDLEAMGAIHREKGDYDTRRIWIPRKNGRGHYGRELEWKKPPTITISGDLHATSRAYRLEELLRNHHIEGGASR